MKDLTRRQFGQTLAAAAALAGTAVPKFAFGRAGEAENVAGHDSGRKFPEGFKWGCATAAYQIEGGAKDGGRGPSVWDVFSHTPGKTHEGQTGDVADDSYHLYKTDVQLLKNLGVQTYRMSISWSRIFPEGKGQPNPAGIDYYNRVIDELLANNITPYVTLFHWDLPAALPGGWQSRSTSLAYADYAAYIAQQLSDRVKHFMTINEFACFTDLGYENGQFAPGLKLGPKEVNQARHHGILAHGLGVQAIRANAKGPVEVGLAENAQVFVPVMETEEHIRATQRATRVMNAPFLTALMEGKYIDEYLAKVGPNAPKVEAGDFAAIGSPLDFVGVNIYSPEFVRASDARIGFAIEKRPASFPHMASPWINIAPECLYWGIRNVCDLWKPKAMYVTENGCSSADVLTADGHVADTDRVMYLRNHITNLHRAEAEGYPIKGYFLWSLMDNFEWDDGYSKRFGIHYVDYKTLKRYPKLSAEWYREVIRRNEVV
jgi:beta-glucosidase